MKSTKQLLGLEAISFQDGKSKLMSELADEIGHIRAIGTFTNNLIARSRIAQIIAKHTGISTAWELDENTYMNAYIFLPDMNINHPLLESWERAFRAETTLTELVQRTKSSKLQGTVDRKNSRVYGCFTQTTSSACLTKGILSSKEISDSGIAAVILHELGHLFTYYELLMGTVTLNYATATATANILKTNNPVERVEILTEFETVCGVRLDDKETIVRTDDKGVIFSQVFGSVIRDKRDETGMPVYSYNSCEYVADQFAVRHGAGFELAKTLEVMFRDFKDPSTRTWAAHIFTNILGICFTGAVGSLLGITTITQVAAVVGSVSFNLVGAVAIVGAMLFISVALMLCPPGDIYDKPRDRVSRIIREYNAALKDTRLKGDVRQYYLNELNSLYAIEKTLVDKRSWTDAVWAYMIPSGRKARKDEQFQQAIEKLANNSIFAAAAQFK